MNKFIPIKYITDMYTHKDYTCVGDALSFTVRRLTTSYNYIDRFKMARINRAYMTYDKMDEGVHVSHIIPLIEFEFPFIKLIPITNYLINYETIGFRPSYVHKPINDVVNLLKKFNCNGGLISIDKPKHCMGIILEGDKYTILDNGAMAWELPWKGQDISGLHGIQINDEDYAYGINKNDFQQTFNDIISILYDKNLADKKNTSVKIHKLLVDWDILKYSLSEIQYQLIMEVNNNDHSSTN